MSPMEESFEKFQQFKIKKETFKFNSLDEPRAKYKCCVCEKLIQNRCITAMGRD